ncbi:uncharacterized protein LOC121404600 [Drosophila obscura]|uniref:uncharacterized protein LOC121404600 n=1 Tax=Drosophila obscura TaxID=7282 RepID=UPI001BB14BF8|nr:uncharacterized protein LOC121404600 [Drosophila obscura]
MRFLTKICKKDLASEKATLATHFRDIEDVNNVIYRMIQEEAYSEETTLLRQGSIVASTYGDRGQRDATVISHIRLRARARAIAKTCQKCRNKRALPETPEIGSLPPERLAINELPFTNTGIDHFGPLEVNVGRRREKRWGVLFTCLTVRAVHIELANSLSTDAFMLMLEMFVARRGVPKRIVSDNGTNFRGASRLLQEEIARISSDELETKYPEIEWSFIPPGAPHMGGAWERMIRSVKSILSEILEEKHVQEPVLRAALAKIENMLNSRPLTYVPLESPEADVLTPNHFLRAETSSMAANDDSSTIGVSLGKSFRIAGQMADSFRKRWLKEYLPSLTSRTKWHGPPTNPIDKSTCRPRRNQNFGKHHEKRRSLRRGECYGMNLNGSAKNLCA